MLAGWIAGKLSTSSCSWRRRLGFNGLEVLRIRSSSVIVTGVGIGEGVDGVDGKDVVESLSDIGAVVVVVADASSGSMTADGRADGHLGWA